MKELRKSLQAFDKKELDTKVEKLFLEELMSEIVNQLQNKTIL